MYTESIQAAHTKILLHRAERFEVTNINRDLVLPLIFVSCEVRLAAAMDQPEWVSIAVRHYQLNKDKLRSPCSRIIARKRKNII